MPDIWGELMTMERRLDELFRTAFGTRARTSAPALGSGAGLVHRPFAPSADVFARNGDLVVDLELPGIDADNDVKVLVEDGVLVVRGERRHTEKVEEKDYYRMETSYGAFERHVPLPEGITDKDVEATYNQGILEIVAHGATKAREQAEHIRESRTVPIKKTGSS